MNKAPWGYSKNALDDVVFRNGKPSIGNEAQQLDLRATWQAATLKRNQPFMMGQAYGSGTTWFMRLRFPQFTPYFTPVFLCDGSGSITIRSDKAGGSTSFTISNGNGLDPTFAKADWYPASDPIPIANQLPNGDSAPVVSDWYFSITDTSPYTLKVYGISVILQPPVETVDLI